MNILVRLPNWLGDVVMSLAFLDALREVYPGCTIDVIVTRAAAALPGLGDRASAVHVYPREEYRGLRGGLAFGRKIRATRQHDLFFCLPRSFSSAWMGRFTASRIRVGHSTEMRRWLFTHPYARPHGLHRVDEYLHLLRQYSGVAVPPRPLTLGGPAPGRLLPPSGTNLLLNINSEAQSRRVPAEFAGRLVTEIRRRYDFNVLLTGSEGDLPCVTDLARRVGPAPGVFNYAGETDLADLVGLLARVDYVITTDSGVAHLANALSRPTIVFFGAGDERRTRPYNPGNLQIVRARGLDCAPCVANTCPYGTPRCLAELDLGGVLQALDGMVAAPEASRP